MNAETKIRPDAKRTIEEAAYKGYMDYCRSIGVVPLPLEAWRDRTRQAFRERANSAMFESH